MSDLILTDLSAALPAASPEYAAMLRNIQERMPAVARDSDNFHKSHSQFMGVMLDVTAITPIRSIKHTLAEIDRTRAALQENYFSLRKKQVEMRQKEAAAEAAQDPFEREMLEVEAAEIRAQLATSQNYINGAIRKMNFFINQHRQLLEKIGKTEITEADYEREEARYHIMTALKQALNAARARNGVIDEGNLIYFFDLGINAAQVQAEILAYLQLENQLISEGKAPTFHMTLQWLEACADRWQDEPAKFAAYRGFSTLDPTSLTNSPQGVEE